MSEPGPTQLLFQGICLEMDKLMTRLVEIEAKLDALHALIKDEASKKAADNVD
jgi:hypothetical protein